MNKNYKKIVEHYIKIPFIFLVLVPLVGVWLGRDWIDLFVGMTMMTFGYLLAYTGRDIEVLSGETKPVLGDLFKKGEAMSNRTFD